MTSPPIITLTLELLSHGGNTAGFVVPDDVVERLGGGRRPQVVLGVAGHEFPTSIARMGEQFLVGLSQARRGEAGVATGDVLEISLRLDLEPRTVEVPEDLAAALDGDPDLASAWESWSPSRRKEAARQLTEAKKQETRATRLQKITGQLAG